MGTEKLTMTPVDELKYQNELIRTGDVLPLGRMQKISIGPSAAYTPPAGDAYIAKFGRIIDLRDRFLPIAKSRDGSMILVTAPLRDLEGRVSLPDLPDPGWTPAPPSREEILGRQEIDKVSGKEVTIPYTDLARIAPRMIPQRLEDRTNEVLEGTGGKILVFQPVLRMTFQPELEGRLVGTAWWIECKFNPVNKTHCALLIDRSTGETHFFGGCYEVCAPGGE